MLCRCRIYNQLDASHNVRKLNKEQRGGATQEKKHQKQEGKAGQNEGLVISYKKLHWGCAPPLLLLLLLIVLRPRQLAALGAVGVAAQHPFVLRVRLV